MKSLPKLPNFKIPALPSKEALSEVWLAKRYIDEHALRFAKYSAICMEDQTDNLLAKSESNHLITSSISLVQSSTTWAGGSQTLPFAVIIASIVPLSNATSNVEWSNLISRMSISVPVWRIDVDVGVLVSNSWLLTLHRLVRMTRPHGLNHNRRVLARERPPKGSNKASSTNS